MEPERKVKWNPARPWDPQPCDREGEHYWFQLYCTALTPPRDLNVLRVLGCNWTPDELYQVSKRNGWHVRARCYDHHLAQVSEAALLAEIEDRAKGAARRYAASVRMTTLGDEELKRLLRAQGRSEQHGTISPELAARMVDRGVAAEIAILDAYRPEQSTSDLDWSRLDDRELAMLQSLTRKAQGAA